MHILQMSSSKKEKKESLWTLDKNYFAQRRNKLLSLILQDIKIMSQK